MDPGLRRRCRGHSRRILEELLSLGWRVLRTRKHIVLEQPGEGGVRIVMASSPSDFRSWRGLITQLRHKAGVDLRYLFGGAGYVRAPVASQDRNGRARGTPGRQPEDGGDGGRGGRAGGGPRRSRPGEGLAPDWPEGSALPDAANGHGVPYASDRADGRGVPDGPSSSARTAGPGSQRPRACPDRHALPDWPRWAPSSKPWASAHSDTPNHGFPRPSSEGPQRLSTLPAPDISRDARTDVRPSSGQDFFPAGSLAGPRQTPRPAREPAPGPLPLP